MKHLIAYVHFLGFTPALLLLTHDKSDVEFTQVMMSAVFSWGVTATRMVELWLL